MTTQIFVNLPVKDLEKSKQFFEQLGFSFNPKFSDEKAACLVIKEGSIYAMLLTAPFFQGFTKKKIANAHQTTEVLIAIDVESKKAVDELVAKAVAAGGSTYMEAQDHGWMYQHSFADLDGHQWEIMYGDENAIPNE